MIAASMFSGIGGAELALPEADNRTGKLRTNAAVDGPRYKALGSAWAVNCVRPIAHKIKTLQEVCDG